MKASLLWLLGEGGNKKEKWVENVYIVSSVIKNRTSEVTSLIYIVHKFNQWLPEGITSYTKNTDINFHEGFLLNDTKTIISPSSIISLTRKLIYKHIGDVVKCRSQASFFNWLRNCSNHFFLNRN